MTAPDGQTVVVTGANSLSLAIARRFGLAGAHTVLADVDRAAGQIAVAALSGEGLSAAFEPLDVRDPGQSRSLVARIAAARGAIDVWVNNAGIAGHGPAEALSHRAWDDSLAAILSGAFYCAQAVGAHMLGRGQGVIVNVAGVDAFRAIEGHAASGAAKAGLVALTRALGIEWAARGVRVVGVAPAEMLVSAEDPEAPPEPAAIHARRTPLRRLGSVEEVAEAVFFLASEVAAFIVGETLRVDGGWTAYHLF